MRIKCDYCGSVFEDTLDRCPSCGASNAKRIVSDKKPRTIEELAQWYVDRNLPPSEVTRFFIGRNYTEPKAFGIYKNEQGEFVVYKNKADGSRAIRYQGGDEEYAVNELWLKLKDEIVHQKAINNGRARGANTNTKGLKFFIGLIMCVWVLPFAIGVLSLPFSLIFHANDGYYSYYGRPYYKDGFDWYVYDTSGYGYSDWKTTTEPAAYGEGYTNSDYYMGDDYSDATGWQIDDSYFSDVKNSSTWDDNHTSSSSDSDYDWGGSDSWDSGGSDWDSDW